MPPHVATSPPLWPTQLPAQPKPNPKKNPQQQPVYANNAQQYPAHALEVTNIHLRSGTTLPTPKPHVNPHFPQRLRMEKPIPKEDTPFDILDQLKNMHIQIPHFQAIKDVLLYGKAIKEACLKKPRRKKKDPQTVHVIGQLEDIMLGKIVIPKHSNLGSPLVDIIFNSKLVKNFLIDFGSAINVMTKDTMHR